MALGVRLLTLAAKIALDKLIGSSRTDEAVELLKTWWGERSESARDREVMESKQAVSEPNYLEQVVAEHVAAGDSTLTPEQIDFLKLSIMSGIKALPDHLGADQSDVKTITKALLPGQSKTFVMWLDHPAFRGPCRYVHFYWDDESWRVRDYIGGKVFHPPGKEATDKGLTAVVATATSLEVWSAGRGQVQSLKRFGLNFPIDRRDEWTRVLSLLSRAADELQPSQPRPANFESTDS